MANNALIGIAGVHYVAMELSRRGVIALPTVKNIAAYDIVAINVEGTRHANIQVKASSKRVSFFLIPPSGKIRTGRHDFYVLVRWLKTEQRYEGFLLTGREAKTEAKAAEAEHKSRAGITRSPTSTMSAAASVAVGPKNARKAKRWSKAWGNWKL